MKNSRTSRPNCSEKREEQLLTLGVLDGTPFGTGPDYPFGEIFHNIARLGVRVVVLVPDGSTASGGRIVQHRGVRYVTTATYEGLALLPLLRHPLAGALQPMLSVVREADAILLRVPSPLAPVVHAVARMWNRPVIPFFKGEWGRAISQLDTWRKVVLGMANVPWRSYHAFLASRYAFITTGPFKDRPRAQLGTFIPVLPRTTLPSERRDFLYVGRLTVAKGVDLLVRAASLLTEPTHFTIVGDGPERGLVESLVGRLGVTERFTFLGRQSRRELPRLYAAHAGVILPSRTEGIPKVLLEAAHFGCRVVAPSVGGIPDLPNISDVAHLYTVGDVQAMARSLDEAARAGPLPEPVQLTEWLASYDAGTLILDTMDVALGTIQ